MPNDDDNRDREFDFVCPYCGRDTSKGGVFVNGGRTACQLCYEQNHPPRPAETFAQMLRDRDGQDFVQADLEKRFCPRTMHLMLQEFNCRRYQKYVRKIRRLIERREEDSTSSPSTTTTTSTEPDGGAR